MGVDKLFNILYTIGIGSVAGWSAYFNAYTIAFTWNQINF